MEEDGLTFINRTRSVLNEFSSLQESKRNLEENSTLKDQEILSLQHALTRAQNLLFEQRQLIISLTQENENLKVQELQDRNKIEKLLQFYDGQSLSTTSTDELSTLKAQKLKEELDEQRRFYKTQIDQLNEERRILSEDIISRSSQYFEELSNSQKEQDRFSNALVAATNDFMTIQENSIRVNQTLKLENDKLKEENDELQYTLSQLYKSSVNELKRTQRASEDQTNYLLAEMKSMSKSHIERGKVVKSQYSKEYLDMLNEYNLRIKQMQDQITRAKHSEEHYRLKAEGYRNETLILKKQIQELEYSLYNLK